MTLSDLDLETRLRQQRTRAEEVAPPPVDLAQRIRVRAREQRRRRIALTAAGVAAALVFVGLPTLASGVLDRPAGGEAASPSAPRSRTPSNFDHPTRGSLAGDEEWLAGVRALSWLPEDAPTGLELNHFPDPDPENRKVAFAGDVPGGRVALVLGRLGTGQLAQAWYTGPDGAQPEDMVLATQPWDAPRDEPMALWTIADPGRATLVVVSRPGDQVEVLTGRDVAASGETSEIWQSVPVEDGAGALSLGNTRTWPFSNELKVRRVGQHRSVYPQVQISDEAMAAAAEPVEVADPRGLLGAAESPELDLAVRGLISHYGLPADRLGPTLLVAGPVGGATGMSATLVGVTFPSGAMTVHLVTLQKGPGGARSGTTSMSLLTDPVPAGAPLLERVFALPAEGSIVISAPAAGVLAEVYLADGTLLTTLPLVDGAGSGLVPPPAAAYVRVLDASGGVVGESPLMGQGG